MNDFPMPEHPDAASVQMVPTDFGPSKRTTQSIPTRNRSTSIPPVPGMWWMLSACLIALVAVGGQATSLFGLITANTQLARLEASAEARQQYLEDVEELRAMRAALRAEVAKLRATHEDIGEQLASEEARLSQQAEQARKHDESRRELLARFKHAEDGIALAEETLTKRHGQLEALQTKHNTLQREVLENV